MIMQRYNVLTECSECEELWTVPDIYDGVVCDNCIENYDGAPDVFVPDYPASAYTAPWEPWG